MLSQDFYNYVHSSNADDINSGTGFNLEEPDAQYLTERYRTAKGITKSPSHFIGADVLNQFCKTPGFLGINLYPGLTDDGIEVLIAIPAGKINGEFQDILSSSFTVNNLPDPQTETGKIIILRPCPPCPKINSVNSKP